MRRWVVLRARASAVHLGVEVGGAVVWLEERPLDPPGDVEALAGALDVLLARREARGARAVRVAIEPPWVQLRTLAGLPPVAPADLETLVRAGARRFFRAAAGPLVTAARWTTEPGGSRAGSSGGAADGAAGRTARAAAGEVALVRAIEEALERVGVADAVVVAGVDGPGGALRLESPERAVRRVRRRRWITAAWWIGALAAWLAAAAVYAADLAADGARARRELEALGDPGPRVARVRERVAAFAPVAAAVRAQGPEGAWVSPLLGDLAAALPPGAFLESVEALEGMPFRLTVFASDPVEVVRALAGAGFTAPALLGTPATLDGVPGALFRLEVAAGRGG